MYLSHRLVAWLLIPLLCVCACGGRQATAADGVGPYENLKQCHAPYDEIIYPDDPVAHQTSVTALAVSTSMPEPSVSQWTIHFRTSQKGGLAAGETITLAFPCDSGAFNGIPLDSILVNGIPAGAADHRSSQDSMISTFPTPVAIAPESDVTISILPNREGMKGPPAGTYDMYIATATDQRLARVTFQMSQTDFFYFTGNNGFRGISPEPAFAKVLKDPTKHTWLLYVQNLPTTSTGAILAQVTSETDPVGISVVLERTPSTNPVFIGELGFTKYGKVPGRLKVSKSGELITARAGTLVATGYWYPTLQEFYQITGTVDLHGLNPSQTTIELLNKTGARVAIICADGSFWSRWEWDGHVQMNGEIVAYTFFLPLNLVKDSNYYIRVRAPGKEGVSAPFPMLQIPTTDPPLRGVQQDDTWPIDVAPVALHADTTPPDPPVIISPQDGAPLGTGPIVVRLRAEPFSRAKIEFDGRLVWESTNDISGEYEFGQYGASPQTVTITVYDRSGNAAAPVVIHLQEPTEPPPPVKPGPKPVSHPPAPDQAPAPVQFSDLPAGHWASVAVTALAMQGIVHGVDETRFAPEDPLTRAQFAALLARSLNLPTSSGNHPAYSDVQPTDWYSSVVQAATEAKLVIGSDGAFRPDAQISRQEMAVILARVLALRGKAKDGAPLVGLADAPTLADWARESIAQVTNQGLMAGRPDHRFDGSGSATRAEAAVAIYRLLQLLGK